MERDMETGIEHFDGRAFQRSSTRSDWNQWIEIGLLWLAVLVVIGFWR